jgi:predicted ATPase
MTKIKIQNVGPISDVEISLNKVNVLMGPQSSGKSTIAKIISYCQWVEKRYLLDGEYKYSVTEQLLDFHRLSENYFSEKSLFEYESDFVKIGYKGKKLSQTIRKKKNNIKYEKTKNIYIPSERNFVSSIPNLSRYKETNDNVMSFVYDWYSAKRKFTKQNLLPILNLDVSFYNNEENDLDVLILNKNRKEILLRESSSGLQSVTPLALIFEYLTNFFYKESLSKSITELDTLNQIISKNIRDIFDPKRFVEYKTKKSKDINITLNKGEVDNLLKLVKLRTTYHRTNFIIEEPEQNLFPETQRDLIYYMFKNIQIDRNHSLTLTTHSPYILYAINNCLMGELISKETTKTERKGFLSKDSWISPSLVNIFEIDANNGTIKSIKDEDTGTVNKHYFNKIMNNIMDEYYKMLNHLKV